MNETIISSTQNPRVKQVIKLQKSSERREQGLTSIEGIREISLAISAGFEIDTLFLCPDLYVPDPLYPVPVANEESSRVVKVNRKVFAHVAYRSDSGGVLALAKPNHAGLSSLALPAQCLVLVLESIEKPGNLGAILRTADAAGIDAVIVCDPRTDIYNPNVIRSSLGCVFTNKVIMASSSDTLGFLRSREIKTYAAALGASRSYHEVDFTVSSAIVMGAEDQGLSSLWLEGANEQILIPMQGKIDSLNVSASTAILVFEAKRQRGFAS